MLETSWRQPALACSPETQINVHFYRCVHFRTLAKVKVELSWGIAAAEARIAELEDEIAAAEARLLQIDARIAEIERQIQLGGCPTVA